MAAAAQRIFEGLRDHADSLDARLTQWATAGERAERNGLVAGRVDRIALRVPLLRVDLSFPTLGHLPALFRRHLRPLLSRSSCGRGRSKVGSFQYDVNAGSY